MGLENFDAAEKALNTGLAVLQKMDDVDLMLYNQYANLAKFYISTNLDRAVNLLAALLSRQQVEKVPFNFQSEYRFLLGVTSPDNLRPQKGIQLGPGFPQRVHRLHRHP